MMIQFSINGFFAIWLLEANSHSVITNTVTNDDKLPVLNGLNGFVHYVTINEIDRCNNLTSR